MFCWLSQILLYIRQVLLYAIMWQSNVWESEQFNIKCHSNCSIWCIQETVPFTHCTVLWVRTRQYCKPKHFNLFRVLQRMQLPRRLWSSDFNWTYRMIFHGLPGPGQGSGDGGGEKLLDLTFSSWGMRKYSTLVKIVKTFTKDTYS